MIDQKLKFIDLFAGIGGMRIAFERNDCECVFSSEWDTFAQKTYFENFNEMPYGDITKIRPSDVPDHDVLIGGFPCQPFSTIGKREGFKHPTQGTLFFDVVQIIKKKRPSVILLENVAGLISHNKGDTYQKIKETLHDELGYSIESKILDSADYGVPQHRRRIYIVGIRNDLIQGTDIKFSWPKPLEEKVGIGSFVESHQEGYNISKHLQDVYMKKVDDGRPQVIDSNSDFPVKTLVSTYHKIQRLTGTFVKDGSTGLRLLSENECKAIMGFPDNFRFPVSRTQMYRQMGNSVAIPVVQALAESLVSCITEVNKLNVELSSQLALA